MTLAASTSTSISSAANPFRSSEYFTELREDHQKRNLESIIERQKGVLGRVLSIMSKKIVREIMTVITLYVSIALITGFILSSATASSFEDALFESVSAISTTGMSAGITSLSLDSFSKLLLVVNMIVGRFEIIAILYIFFRYFRK